MEISDLLISTVRDIRLSLLSGSDDSVEPPIAALTKDVNKHPDFEGQKISQAMVRKELSSQRKAAHGPRILCKFLTMSSACAAERAGEEGSP